MKTTSEQWLAAAEDDLRVIARIAADPRLTHMVAFHCQQCIEKTLKAVIEEYAMGHVRIHNLIRLFEIVKPQVAFDIDVVLIETLDKLYIDARYPADFCLLPRGKPTQADAKRFWDYAKGIYDEVKRELEQRPEG